MLEGSYLAVPRQAVKGGREPVARKEIEQKMDELAQYADTYARKIRSRHLPARRLIELNHGESGFRPLNAGFCACASSRLKRR